MSAPTTTALVATAYPQTWVHLGRGRYGDLLTADLRLALVSSSYTAADGHAWWADAQDFETAGPGYTPGGQQVTGRSLDYDPAAGRAPLGCYTVTWADAAFIARTAIAYVTTDDPATSPLLARIDLGVEVNPGGQDFNLTFSAGLLRIGPGAP